MNDIDRLSPALISSGLGTRWLGREIIYYERVGSTNDEARRLAGEGAEEGTLVIADEQSAGRGRLGRPWLAPARQALLFSLIFRPDRPPRELFPLIMLASVACLHAIEKETGLAVAIKWPNDLLLDGRKVAGILSEIGQPAKRPYVIVGIGLNVNVDFQSWPELGAQATSLREALGRPVPRLPLLQEILRQIELAYDRFRAGYSPYDEWVAHLSTLGREVRVTTAEGTLAGRAVAVDSDGALCLVLPDGTRRRILTGDVERLR